ncbi:hypothetical protein ScPMuIL_008495 [Solemya velum]
MAAISALQIALLIFAVSTIWARSVKDCENRFQNCMDKDGSNLTDCALKMFGCLRKYCDRHAALSRTKHFLVAQLACYAKHGIVSLIKH